jgi:hypothetical protein
MGEALALTSPYRGNRAVLIAVPKPGAVVVAEIEFRQNGAERRQSAETSVMVYADNRWRGGGARGVRSAVDGRREIVSR